MQKKPDDIKTSFHAHTISVEDIETRFNSSLENGLSSEEVRSRQDNYGLNELREGKKAHWSLQLFRQFKSVVIAILVFAAVISAFVGEWVEAWAILGIVILNGVLGFVQESRAEKALAALRKMTSPKSRAIRNGSAQVVPSKDLVIGDLIELEAGDQVPADARLIESYSFSTQESSLTGESTPVEKKASEVFDANTPIGDRINMVFGGTLVLSGQAKAIVTSTGMNTELGKIAEMLESEEQQQTPLQKRLTELGHVIMYLCLAIVFCVAILQWYRGQS
ncbi:MAG: HAD-IC family P-type ATPase [Bdellovibrionota bacterium]